MTQSHKVWQSCASHDNGSEEGGRVGDRDGESWVFVVLAFWESSQSFWDKRLIVQVKSQVIDVEIQVNLQVILLLVK